MPRPTSTAPYPSPDSIPSDWSDFPEMYLWTSFIERQYIAKHGRPPPESFFDNLFTARPLKRQRHANSHFQHTHKANSRSHKANSDSSSGTTSKGEQTLAMIALENAKLFPYKRDFHDNLRDMVQLQNDARLHCRGDRDSQMYRSLVLEHEHLASHTAQLIQKHKLINFDHSGEIFTKRDDLASSWC